MPPNPILNTTIRPSYYSKSTPLAGPAWPRNKPRRQARGPRRVEPSSWRKEAPFRLYSVSIYIYIYTYATNSVHKYIYRGAPYIYTYTHSYYVLHILILHLMILYIHTYIHRYDKIYHKCICNIRGPQTFQKNGGVLGFRGFKGSRQAG